MAYISQSVTTYQNLNLGYRFFVIDGDYNETTSVRYALYTDLLCIVYCSFVGLIANHSISFVGLIANHSCVLSSAPLSSHISTHSLSSAPLSISQCVVDHINYYMDLNKTSESTLPVWQFEYSAMEAYNMPDLQPQSWTDLVQRFQKNNTLFLEYFQYVNKLYNHWWCACLYM